MSIICTGMHICLGPLRHTRRKRAWIGTARASSARFFVSSQVPEACLCSMTKGDRAPPALALWSAPDTAEKTRQVVTASTSGAYRRLSVRPLRTSGSWFSSSSMGTRTRIASSAACTFAIAGQHLVAADCADWVSELSTLALAGTKALQEAISAQCTTHLIQLSIKC